MSSSAVDATESIAPPEVYKVFRKVGLSVSPPLNPPPQPQTNSHVTFPFFPVEVLGMRAGDSSSNSACTRLFFFLLLTFQTLSALPSHHFPLLYELFSNIFFLALSQTVTNKPPPRGLCVCVCVWIVHKQLWHVNEWVIQHLPLWLTGEADYGGSRHQEIRPRRQQPHCLLLWWVAECKWITQLELIYNSATA